jgi:hypothetical protein
MNKTIPADLRKAAKTMARERGLPHQTALDLLARQAGHAGWGALLASRRTEIDPFRRLIVELWNDGGTDLHIEPWMATDQIDETDPEGPMTIQERHLLLSRLSTMLAAKVPAPGALRLMRQHGGRIAFAVAALEERLSGGQSLLEAMSSDQANFSSVAGMLARTGSVDGGGTARTLRRAAEHQEALLSLATTSRAGNGMARHGARILFRIHGRRHLVSTLDADAFDALKAAIVPCMTEWDDVRPVDGCVRIEIEGMRHAFPVASFPANGSHKFVARIPDRHVAALSLEQLGIRDLDEWMRICRSGPGIVIVSGTTSSGKSTTIARTVERLRSEGVDAFAEEQNAPYHEDRVAAMIEAAGSRTVILEAYGSSLDRAIANAMAMGLGNQDLARLSRGGMHQQLHPASEGPRTLDTMIMPWG